ncbi:MAG TPA: lipoyl(octanoyl) transferase LipB [Gemmatimonadales bacterium]|nr:lipoyl(octanoyl) transferase LipB [Gemmatimonadales bacterium]
MGTLGVVDLGRRAYGQVLELQRRLAAHRAAGSLPHDLLLLVEHDPVVTLGRGTRETSLPIPPARLGDHGVEVFEIERGGDVTYHGPGQLVGYPIVDLSRLRPDLHWYLRELEGALIDGLGVLGIPARRRPGLTGVWVEDRKVASIGIHVKRWVTFHGFALNVVNDLRPFDLIVPCGIHGVTMTSVARELGEAAGPALWVETRAAVVRALADRLGMAPAPVGAEALPGNPAGPPGVGEVDREASTLHP